MSNIHIQRAVYVFVSSPKNLWRCNIYFPCIILLSNRFYSKFLKIKKRFVIAATLVTEKKWKVFVLSFSIKLGRQTRCLINFKSKIQQPQFLDTVSFFHPRHVSSPFLFYVLSLNFLMFIDGIDSFVVTLLLPVSLQIFCYFPTDHFIPSFFLFRLQLFFFFLFVYVFISPNLFSEKWEEKKVLKRNEVKLTKGVSFLVFSFEGKIV